MGSDGFDSPELAAMSTFPSEYCRVIASRTSGDDAYVLLDTGPRDRPYLYGINCHRREGRWIEGGSGNGPGWQETDHPGVGTLSLWAEAPEGAERVRVAFDGEITEVAVTEGVYLVVWWRVRQPDEWPHVIGFVQAS